jgi:hypothetical protein
MASCESEIASVSGRGPRPGHPRMSRIDTKEHQKWIA